MKKQMSAAFLSKLQDKKQFNENNYGSHMTGMSQQARPMKVNDSGGAIGMMGQSGGPDGMKQPSESSIQRILRMRNANVHR